MGERRTTSTSNFGVGRRESHDASAFYARFARPELSADATVAAPAPVAKPFVRGDARDMGTLADNSVALVVTSPPYFAGKQYEEELGRDGVPASYVEYLEMLRDVFAECKRVLEPGGRIAVNVANLGRKPYRSLSSDVIRVLQDDLKLLLRGEVIWKKADGASGSCAWGSFRSAANPVLRDITERVVVASKGRFDRAGTATARRAGGLPHENTLTSDEFMEATLDVWDIAPESARRVDHPAPFPVELPERLIRLYTFKDDLVLDPFMGSGSTLVAAARWGRRYVGYDLDPDYVRIAKKRVAAELKAASAPGPAPAKPVLTVAEQVLIDAGFDVVGRDQRMRGLGLAVDLVAKDAAGTTWYFDVSGAFTTTRGGLLRNEAAWKALGRANVLARNGRMPLVLLTSHLPKRRSEADQALRAAGPSAFFDAVELLTDEGFERLEKYAQGGHHHRPGVGFWSDAELDSPA
ncbi:MAG TPA: site-specific DNA-methyltransferase [Acidimicrobiales bacterium]|nr:site-specific DNA-methyltransferase [Acidimicrobiales bacterium]